MCKLYYNTPFYTKDLKIKRSIHMSWSQRNTTKGQLDTSLREQMCDTPSWRKQPGAQFLKSHDYLSEGRREGMQAGDSKREARVQVCAQVGYGQEKLMIAEDKAKHVKWIRSTQSCSTKMTELIIF